MDWIKKLTDKIEPTTKRVKETLGDVGEKINTKSERVYNAMFPLLSPIPKERNAIKEIFDAIFSKDEEPTQPQIQEPEQTNQPPVVEPTPVPTSTPIPTPTPIIDITPEGETKMYGRNPNVKKFTVDSPIYDAINSAAEEFGVPAALLFDIALKESKFKPEIVNTEAVDLKGFPTNPSGLFQFTDETWEDVHRRYDMPESNEDRLDPVTSARMVAFLIKKGELWRWNASKYPYENPDTGEINKDNIWGDYWKDDELEKLGYYQY